MPYLPYFAEVAEKWGFRQLIEDHGDRLSPVDRLKYEALSNAAGYALAVELLNAGNDLHGSR